jgi:hypothetical protein
MEEEAVPDTAADEEEATPVDAEEGAVSEVIIEETGDGEATAVAEDADAANIDYEVTADADADAGAAER